jgi:large subunit ribosomal protein L13
MSSHLLKSQRTPFVRNEDIRQNWILVDAENQTLGRLASLIAYRIQGKHRVDQSLHQRVGDFVVVINAEKVAVTGKKMEQKIYYHHSRYPGGLRVSTLSEKMKKDPVFALETAVKRMLPKGPRGRKMALQLKVYAGPDHPHQAQKPTPVVLNENKQ